MIRRHENPIAIRAGALSVLVHVVLLSLLIVSFNWKTVKTIQVAEVELWDSLPQPEVTPPPPAPEPEPEPPKPEPVVKEQPKPEPAPEPKAEIEIKKKVELKVEPKKEEKPKPDPKIKEAEKKRQEQEKLKKLQQELLAEDSHAPQKEANDEAAKAQAAQSAAALKTELDKYIGLVSAKIRPYVNKQLCGTGKPDLVFEISLLPTGEIQGEPKLAKSSGIVACDEAVERAIRQSNPLPRPSAELMPQVRELKLKFRPNDDN